MFQISHLHFVKKYTRFTVLLIISVLLISSCSLKKDVNDKVNYDGIELTYYKMFDDSDVIKPIIAEYEADHKGLKIHYKQFTDFEEYNRVILNEMAEGEGPDIFSMQNTWFVSNYKKIAPMPFSTGTPDLFAKTFVDVTYKDLVRVGPNGEEKIYALPMTVDTLALYYNKDHFEDRIPASGEPADTWEGIKANVEALTKSDNSFSRLEVSGIALGRSDNVSRAVDIVYLLFLQYGVDFYNDNLSEAVFASKSGGFSNYPAEDALDFFLSFSDEDQKHYTWSEFSANVDSKEKELDAFVRGDVSMIIGFAYTYEEIMNYIGVLKGQGVKTIDPDSVHIAAIPQLIDPDVSSDKRVTYANYFAETVSRNSEHSDVAWDFLVELTKRENLDYYFDKTNKPTSRRDMIEDQMNDPIYGVFASQIGYAESFAIIDYYAYKDIFSTLISDVNDGGSYNLKQAQDMITELLPASGLVFPKIEQLTEEE